MYLLKYLIRVLSEVIGVIIAIPFVALAIIFSNFNRYKDISQIVSLIPSYFGEKVRYRYYKYTLKHVGNNVIFRFGVVCQSRNAEFGSNVTVGDYSIIANYSFGSNIDVGAMCNFISGRYQHLNDLNIKQICYSVGDNCWIGSNAVVMDSVVGETVVGAAAVVVDEIFTPGRYVGNPAKKIK